MGRFFWTPAPLRRTFGLVSLLLVIGGVWFWAWFIGSGESMFTFWDWPKEKDYLDVWREALAVHSLPWHMTPAIQNTGRFLANPEPLIAPQVMLLPWLTDAQFIRVQACLMYLVGLAGCMAVAKRQVWSVFSFGFFSVVFLFNGWITAHLAIGHFMFLGYYLYPWVWLGIMASLEDSDHCAGIKIIGWAFFGLFAVGAFHMVTWWLIFLLVLAALRPRVRHRLLGGAALGLLLGSFRLMPALFIYGRDNRAFLGGYRSLAQMMDAFLVSHPYETSPVPMAGFWTGTFRAYRWDMIWPEFDHFIGIAAAAFIAWFVFIPRRRTVQTDHKTAVLKSAGVLFIFSLYIFYAPLLSLPLFNGEATTSRFISVAFFVVLFLACEEFQLSVAGLGQGARCLALFILVVTVAELAHHALQWRLAGLSRQYPDAGGLWPSAAGHFIEVADARRYLWSVYAGWTISGTVFFLSIFLPCELGRTGTKARMPVL